MTSNQKRIFVLGATGGTGRAIVEQARQRGHRVTAFVRSPQKLGPAGDGLTVIRGDPRNADELRAALPGHDAVLSALGPPGIGPTTIVADSARSTVTAMQTAGVRRLLVVGVAVLFEDDGLLAAIARRTFLPGRRGGLPARRARAPGACTPDHRAGLGEGADSDGDALNLAVTIWPLAPIQMEPAMATARGEPMARDPLRALGFWTFPTALIVVWLAVAVFTLSQLATVVPSLSAAASLPRPPQDRAQERVPRGCLDAC